MKKKHLLRLPALLAVLFLASPAMADDGDTFTVVTPDSVTLVYTVLSEDAKTVSVKSGGFRKDVESFAIPAVARRTVYTIDGQSEKVDSSLVDYSVTTIASYGFRRMKTPTLVIPESIKIIGAFAFSECYSLTKIISLNRNDDVVWAPSSTFSGDSEKFVATAGSTYMGTYERATVLVPFGMQYAYSRGYCWKYFKEIIEGTEEETLAQAPAFSVSGGEYDGPQTIALSNPNGTGDIYYYLTGEDNTSTYWTFYPEVHKYDGTPIELGSTGVVVAYISDGTHRSSVRRESYTIASAALTVAGMQVDAKNQDDVLGDKGSVSVDAKSGALVLNNANIDTEMYKATTGIEIAGGDFTIQLIGRNTITAQDLGIDFGYANGTGTGGNLVITGEGEGASLTVNMNGKGGSGLQAYLANVTIENCAVIINGGVNGIYFKAGGKGDGALALTGNASLAVEAQESAMTGVFELQLADGISILAPEGATFQSPYDDPKAEGNIYAAGSLSASVTIGAAKDDEPEALEPIEEETTTNFGSDLTDGNGDAVDMEDTTVGNVYYNMDDSNGDGYDTTEGCIVINSTTDMDGITDATPGSTDVVGNYTGIIFIVDDRGNITIDYQTAGTNQLTVQVGSGTPATYTSEGATTDSETIPYDVDQPTYVYVYATTGSGSSGAKPQLSDMRKSARRAASAGANAVKIYSIKVTPTTSPTGIEAIPNGPSSSSDTSAAAENDGRTAPDIYTLDGRRLAAKPLQKGIYIQGSRKIVVK